MFESIRRKLGLYPVRLKASAFNPTAVDAAFARANNGSLAPYRDLDGSIRMKDPFGYMQGYSVPLPDDLKAKAGTVYPQG